MKLTIFSTLCGKTQTVFDGHVASADVAARLLVSFAKPGDFIHVGPHSGAPTTQTVLWIEGTDKLSKPASAIAECVPPASEHAALGGYEGESVTDILAKATWLAAAFLPGQSRATFPQVHLYRPDNTVACYRESLTLHAAFCAVQSYIDATIMGRDNDLATEALAALHREMADQGLVGQSVSYRHTDDAIIAVIAAAVNPVDNANSKRASLQNFTQFEGAQNAGDAGDAAEAERALVVLGEPLEWSADADGKFRDARKGDVWYRVGGQYVDKGIYHAWMRDGHDWWHVFADGTVLSIRAEGDEPGPYGSFAEAETACLVHYVSQQGGVA